MCRFPGGDGPGVWLAKQVRTLAARALSCWALESREVGPLPERKKVEGGKGQEWPRWHGESEEVGHY